MEWQEAYDSVHLDSLIKSAYDKFIDSSKSLVNVSGSISLGWWESVLVGRFLWGGGLGVTKEGVYFKIEVCECEKGEE